MSYFRQHPETGVTSPHQIAVVGDRLTTDMMLANMMGSWGIWIKDGIVPVKQKSIVSFNKSVFPTEHKLTTRLSSPRWTENWDSISPLGVTQPRTPQIPLNKYMIAKSIMCSAEIYLWLLLRSLPSSIAARLRSHDPWAKWRVNPTPMEPQCGMPKALRCSRHSGPSLLPALNAIHATR